ncbi:MAG TPA: hypothetical protein VFO48_01795, partial [Vicinamibacterales bacterium]|nr:hypothetical protein [Vicinamibacterales bacterium]
MRRFLIHTLVALLLLNVAVPSARAQNDAPQDDTPAVEVETPPVVSVLEEVKVDAIVDVLMTSYAAALAMHVAVRGAECTSEQPRCAPLFFAQDVILAPWNVIQLLKMTNEQPDPDPAVVERRRYKIHAPRQPGVLPPEMVSLAEYAIEQQVALYTDLEAWRISIDRYRSAVVGNDETAAGAQRRAIETYSAEAATAAAAAGAASMQFLENLTPLMRHFASAISAEDEQAARDDLRDNGFGPDLQGWFSVFRIAQADRDMLRDEIFAIVGDAPVDLMEGLTAVSQGYDRIADVLSVSADGTSNLRPVAQAGPDQ